MKAENMIHPGFPLMKQGDIVSFYHLQMPRWLFTESKYMALSLEAKVAYTFLLNRFQLSRMNGWVNEEGEVFIFFTRESLATEMQVSYRKAIDSFKEVVKAQLIWEKRLGRGRPNQIYLAAVRLTEEEKSSHASAPFTSKESRPVEPAHQGDTSVKDQLFSLSHLRFGTGDPQFRQDIRQLCYLNRLMETEIFVLLPGRRRDDGVISAVDVMLQFAAGREPEFTAGTGGCKLAFFLTGPEGKVSAFKVYPVARGREALVSAQADAGQGHIHTVLFQIEDRSQIPLLGTAHPFHFVLWEDGCCRFLKGAT